MSDPSDIPRGDGDASRHRLAALRRAEGMTLAQLAHELGVTPDEVERWEDGGEIPPGRTRWLAHRFGVSDTWLTGREQLPTRRVPAARVRRFVAPEARPNRLARLCNADGVAVAELAAELGVTTRDLLAWEEGEIPPPYREPLARRFGVTVDWLLGTETLPSSIRPMDTA